MTPEQIRNELDQDDPRSSFPQYFMQSRQDRDAELWAYDQMSRESAQNRTLTASGGEKAPVATPDAAGASEALVQQIAEALIAEGAGPGNSIHSWRCEYPDMYGPCDCVNETAQMVARAVLPLVEAQVAPLRDEVETLRVQLEHAEDWKPLLQAEYRKAAETWDRQRERLNGEIERLRGWIDRAERMQRERDAAESALRQVREDLTALADSLQNHRGSFDMDRDVALNGIQNRLTDLLARVGAADTQPEGAGEHLRNQPEAIPGTDRVIYHNDAIGIPVERATPTAGGKVDTAPEAGCGCTVTDDVVRADSSFQGRYVCGGCGHEPHPNQTVCDTPPEGDEFACKLAANSIDWCDTHDAPWPNGSGPCDAPEVVLWDCFICGGKFPYGHGHAAPESGEGR